MASNPMAFHPHWSNWKIAIDIEAKSVKIKGKISMNELVDILTTVDKEHFQDYNIKFVKEDN